MAFIEYITYSIRKSICIFILPSNSGHKRAMTGFTPGFKCLNLGSGKKLMPENKSGQIKMLLNKKKLKKSYTIYIY